MGRRFLICVICCVSIFNLCACSKNAFSLDDCLSCVYNVVCSNEGRYDSIGTAFVVGQDTVITNAHVVSYLDDGERVCYDYIMVKEYNSDKKLPLELKTIDFEKDFAILTFKNEEDRATKFLDIGSTRKLSVGDELFTIGNLNNYGLSCNSGILSSYKKRILNNGVYNEYYQTDIEISRGSSGGPVLNKQYEVVGIMTFKVRDSNAEYVDGMSFFIPIDVVTSFI